MAKILPRTRVEVIALLLVVFFAVATWECFTAWGIMAASVGAQVGRMSEPALAGTRERASWLFGLMVLFQVAMLASAVQFIGHKRVAGIWQSFQRPSNWLFGAGLALLTDVLVFGVLLTRQMALAGR